MSRTSIRRACATLALVVGSTGAFLARAGADDSVAVSLAARADIATIEYFDTGVPVIPPATAITQLSPASAHAEVDSLGSSTALASAPDPGAFIRSGPGSAAGGTGQPVPEYPLVVQSNYPTKQKSELSHSGYRITATSARDASTGDTQTGMYTGDGELASSRGVASVSQVSGAPLLASANAELGAFSLGQTLRIARISSVARMKLVPGHPPTTTTSTRIGGLTVNGVSVEMTGNGMEVGGTVVPVDSPAGQQLKAAGIDVRYVPSDRTDTSVLSAGIVVTFAHTDGQGITRTTIFTLGRVSAALSYGTTGARAPATNGAEADSDVAPRPPTLDLVPGALSSGVALPEQRLSPIDGAAFGAGLPIAGQGHAVAATALGPGYMGLYLFCIAAGVAALVASRVLGLAAVQLRLRPSPSHERNT